MDLERILEIKQLQPGLTAKASEDVDAKIHAGNSSLEVFPSQLGLGSGKF